MCVHTYEVCPGWFLSHDVAVCGSESARLDFTLRQSEKRGSALACNRSLKMCEKMQWS